MAWLILAFAVLVVTCSDDPDERSSDLQDLAETSPDSYIIEIIDENTEDRDPDATLDDDGDAPTTACNGECATVEYTACTCDPGDPCGWVGDGICDVFYCSTIQEEFYDDSLDCGSNAACDGRCGLGQYDGCTCGASDPCGWVGDGFCDQDACSLLLPTGSLDDGDDCAGPAGACDGDCSAGRYTGCTCGSSDPCGWVENGICDAPACEGVLTTGRFDDGEDCPGTPGDDTFAVTAVRDNLSNRDMEIMQAGLEDLGMTMAVRDINVSTSSLTSYLSQELTMLYHTGHGNSGEVMTSDGSLDNDVTINVHNTVFATCLTLAVSWASAFGETAETILGYTRVSYDYIDNDVVREMLLELEDGSTYIEAWYLANASIWSLSDRWAGYVREGDEIIEYSARTGVTPDGDGTHSKEPALMVQVGRSGRLWISPGILEDVNIFEGELLAQVEPDTEVFSGFMPGGWSLLSANRMSEEQVLAQAHAFVAGRLGGMPRDAALDAVRPVTARVEGQSPVVVGHLVRYWRYLDGLPVRGNRVSDHITLLVGPHGVAAWSIYWPDLDVEVSTREPVHLLTVAEATRLAADEIARAVKGELRLVRARPIYGTTGPRGRLHELVPAYELIDEEGGQVVVDARTGQPLL